MKRLALAFGFLTRLPIGVESLAPGALGRAALMFPAVGMFIGATQWGLYAAAGAVGWQLHSWLFALLATLFVVLVTGALHLDGLADTCDGLGGGRTPEDVRRIMKDHAVGAYAAVALVLSLGARGVCLAWLCEQRAWAAIAFAPALARASAVVLAYADRPKGAAAVTPSVAASPSGGLGEVFLAGVGLREVIGALLLTLLWGAALLGLFPRSGAALLALGQVALVLLLWLWLRSVARARVGRVTGDVFGALIELAEVLALLGAALVLDASRAPN